MSAASGNDSAKVAIGWTMVAVGFVAPILTAASVTTNFYSAGYTAGRAYLLSLIVVIYAVFATRKKGAGKRGGTMIVAGILVLAANLWSCITVVQDAAIDRELQAARSDVDRITNAAYAEIMAIRSGQAGTSEWQQISTSTAPVDISDRSIPLKDRLIEMTRRGKVREVEFARELDGEIQALDLASALNHRLLADPQNRADVLQRLANYLEWLETITTRAQDLGNLADADIKSLGLPKKSERDMLDGRMRRERDDAPAFQAAMASERAVIAQIDAMVRFIDAHGASVHLVNDALKFRNEANQVEFDRMMAAIESMQ